MSEYKTNAPIYAAELLNLPVKNSKNKTKEHLLIAGGGGKSATGVLNELQLFELTALNAANISQLTTSSPSPIKKILEVSTDISKIPKDLKNTEEKLEFLNNAPMNLSVKNDKLIAVGVGEKVQIYEVFSEQNKQDKEDDGISTVASGRIRKRNVGNSGQENINSRSESSIKLNKISEITDTSLNPDEAPVTRLSFHQNSNFLTTGGSNTDLKFFQYHKLENLEKLSLELKYEILKSHSKELKDISVCKNLVASISDDKNCFVWKVGSDSFEKIWSLREQFYFYFKIKGKIFECRDINFGG